MFGPIQKCDHRLVVGVTPGTEDKFQILKAVYIVQGHRRPYKEIYTALDPYGVTSHRRSEVRNYV